MNYLSKKPRAPRAVFTNPEVELLLSLVDKHKTVNITSEGVVQTQVKLSTWETIHEEFNARTPNEPKTLDALRIKYKNIKQDRAGKGPFRVNRNNNNRNSMTTMSSSYSLYDDESSSNEPQVMLEELDNQADLDRMMRPMMSPETFEEEMQVLAKRKAELEVQHLELQIEKDMLTIDLLRKKLGKKPRFKDIN